MSLKAMSDQDILDDIRSFEEAIRMYRAELERRFQERIAGSPRTEPWLPTDAILKALVLAGWTPPADHLNGSMTNNEGDKDD